MNRFIIMPVSGGDPRSSPPDEAPDPLVQRGAQFPGLHGLRGILALWVVLFHTSPGGFGPIQVPRYGALAVDVFFIMSGFLLMHAHHQDFAPPRGVSARAVARFISLRFWRTIPVHVIAVGLAFVLSWAVFGYVPTAPKLLRSLLLIYSWLMPAHNLLINGAIWSLHFEWLGYFAFPWICMLLMRLRSWRAAATLAVAILAIETIVMLATGTTDPGELVAGPGAFGRMAGGFMLGCVLWVGFQHRAARRIHGDLPMLASVGAIIAILLLTDPVYTLAPMALVVLLAARPGRVTAWLLGHPVSGFLGRISFSLYMIHQPIVHVSQHLQQTSHLPLPSAAFSAGAAVTALVVASVVCIGAEEKLRRYGRRHTPALEPPRLAETGARL